MKYPTLSLATGLLLSATGLPSEVTAQLSVSETAWRSGPTLAFSAESLVVTSSDGRVAARWAYRQKADTLVLAAFAQPGRPCGQSGLYKTQYHRSAQQLLLYAVDDPCAARTALLTQSSTYEYVPPASEAARNWFVSNPEDAVAGIDLDRAYGLLRGRRSVPVIVAVIDNGVDITHPDLAGAIWTNSGEIPDNGLDDDGNGYVDDIHGWNFRGRPDGTVVEEEQASATQLAARWKDRFAGADTGRIDWSEWDLYRRALRDFQSNLGAEADSNSAKVIYNLTPVSSRLIGDDPADLRQTGYGSPCARLTPNLTHGTHVAGIIGARRNNDTGTDGIADNVRIMPLLATTAGGDERDKDVANAIRYAVQNGAKVINLSFSKLYSPDKQVVDEAFRYAEENDVLIVHAAGNDGNNLDSVPHYPTASDRAGRPFTNVITVGWNRPRLNERLAHQLSDYSKTGVDLFAPGSDIFSLLPDNGYGLKSGSSMSAPMVTGAIALLYSYFPSLSSSEVKSIILESVFKPELTVNRPGTKQPVPFSSLSATGGILNVSRAVVLAEAAARRSRR